MSRAPGKKPAVAFSAEQDAAANIRRKLDFMASALGEQSLDTHLSNPAEPVPADQLLAVCPNSIAAFNGWKSADLPPALNARIATFSGGGPKTLKKYKELGHLAKTYVEQVDAWIRRPKTEVKSKLETMASLRRERDEALRLQRIAMSTLHAARADAKYQVAEAEKRAQADRNNLREALRELERLRESRRRDQPKVSELVALKKGLRP